MWERLYTLAQWWYMWDFVPAHGWWWHKIMTPIGRKAFPDDPMYRRIGWELKEEEME